MYREPAAHRDAVESSRLAKRSWWRFGREDARAFLGAHVLVGRRAYLSLDRTRRVRFSAADADARFERIDPVEGVTLRSRRSAADLPRPDLAPRDPVAVWTAPVLGRPRWPVCFVGSRRRAAPEPRMIRLLEYLDGALLVRVAADGGDAGDTWHEHTRAAIEQLERELGSHVGRLRAGDGGRPWRREDPWIAPQRSRNTHTV